MSNQVLESSNAHLAQGDFDRAALLLNNYLVTEFDPGLALSLYSINLRRDAVAEAARVMRYIYSMEPRLEHSGLIELTSAYGLYAARRANSRVAQVRRSLGGPASQWQVSRLAAEIHHARGEYDLARKKLSESAVPSISGRCRCLSGTSFAFSTITDSDALRGATLVCIAHGNLIDVPFSAIRMVDFHGPETCFGSVISPATIHLNDDRVLPVRIPTRYPGSGRHREPAVRLCGKTVWDYSTGYAVAHGMINLRTDTGLVGLGSIQSLEFDPS
jgi:protein involved in temperature-dependent protein secretion